MDFNDHSGLSNGANFVSLKEVVLKKDSSSSIGISFVAGSIPGIYKNGTNGSRQRKQTFSLPAIFVKSLTPGGPADLNGHIKPNDQILAVNGSTVTGLCCQDVIEQINKHNHSTPVQLLLLQRSHKTPNKQSVPPTSNKPNTKLPTSPSHKNCTLPTDQSWSRSANDFISRTLPTSRRHSPGSTLNYFNDHYIPEHHISVPDMLDTLQETKATSTRFSTSILSGSLSSLQECKRQKIVSTRGIHCNFMEKQTGIVPFHNINRLSIPEIPQFKLTLPPSPSLPTFMPYNNQKCSLEFLSTPLASSTPASSPTTQRNARGGHHCMSLTSAKQLLSSKSKQTIFREKPGSIWKQRQNEIFYECFLSKKDGSLGLNIIGGIDTKTELGGVYVKSLRPNGAAEKNGIIKADDRIIQINSINLEEVQHEEAVSLLQDAPIRCLLLLGRKPCNHKPVSHCPPMAIDNGMVPAQDTNQREFLKEETETNRKLAAEVQSNCKHGKLSQEFSLLEAGSEKDRNHREIDLAVSQEKDRTFPKRTICDKSEKKLATLELLSPESHGVQQGKKTKPVGTRTRAEMKAPNNVENIHTGASPTSEDLQWKDNVHFPPQKYDGATKNEGYFRQGPKQDPTLSDGRNGNTLNKVTGNNPDRGKHFENNASLHSGPSDSAVIPAEEQRELHEKDDSPIIQRTAHGSDSSNCSSGGILTEDTSNSDQAKKILMALKQKEYGEAVLLGKDFVECQLESASRRNPMSLSANMANESSTQQVSDPKRANPNDKSGGSSMQQYLSSNKSKFSNETKKADRSVAEIKDETLLQLSLKNNQQPIISRSKLVSSESANDNISENLALNPKLDTSNQEKDKISESLSSSRMEKIPQSISLKSGPTSDIQDDPYKDPLKNLSWLWDVPLVRSPEVTNHDLLRQLLLQLEKSLHSKKYLEDFQLIKQDCFSNAGRTKVALLPENKSKNRSQEYLPCIRLP